MKCIVAIILSLLFFFSCNADDGLKDLWDKYSSLIKTNQISVTDEILDSEKKQFPGIIKGGNPYGQGESAFNYKWKYRSETYEMHFDSPLNLASSIFNLAIFSGDIEKSFPKEFFVKGVQGFHYSVDQICNWLNDSSTNAEKLSDEELAFVGTLLLDKLIFFDGQKYKKGKEVVNHILGASPGKKRSFDKNLRHERLHVFWDNDQSFRETWVNKWNSLNADEKQIIFKKMKNYDQKNVDQIIEEWAIKENEMNSL
jgi:hypothetical protein